MIRTHDWRPASGGGWIARVGAEWPHLVLRVRDAGTTDRNRWSYSASIADKSIALGVADDLGAAKAEARKAAAGWLRDSLAALETP